MTLRELKKNFQEQLKEVYPIEEIDQLFFMIAEKETGYSKSMAFIHFDEPISMGESIMYHNCLNRLKKSEPIQYVLGETEFCGLPIEVDRHTLIPRPETEELVEWIEQSYSSSEPKMNLLDIGTGSGCIAIALAKKISACEVTAWDISKGALEMARRNALNNGVSIQFEKVDILSKPMSGKRWDVVVSNPPYVRQSEKEHMFPNVLNFEPTTALFVSDEDPLKFYRSIAQFAFQHLKPQGWVYFEINEYLSKEVIQLLKAEGFECCELRKDVFGKNRMIRAQKNE